MRPLASSLKRVLNAGSILGLVVAAGLSAQALPEGAGKAAFERTCSACHSTTVVTSRHMSPAGWENVVDNMVSRGAQATSAEQKQIVSYLSANFGAAAGARENAAPEEAAAPPPPPAEPVPALDESQVTEAQKLITSNDCLSCHRMDGKGSFAGPYLGDVGSTHSAEQIRAALVSPSKELTPQNRTVRLVTEDGKTVTGRLLNQDGFSVQLIDAAGHLLSFDRAKLRDFTIVTTNSMPSYANKMGPQDLTLLIKYLETQKGTSAR